MTKFIVDTMLGKLARWLRILGYDTLYNTKFTDDDLFFKAHLEKRILLTRDRELANRMNPDFCLYITPLIVREQLKQVIIKFSLNTKNAIFTRCTICNDLVQPISKDDIENEVPRIIYNSVQEFVHCKKCNKIYWPGSHIKNVNQILVELDETLKKRKR